MREAAVTGPGPASQLPTEEHDVAPEDEDPLREWMMEQGLSDPGLRR